MTQYPPRFCILIALIVAAAMPAMADLSWQTQPILGTSVSNATGDVVVITGPRPLDAYGNPYYAWPGGPIVEGPTIPHYSLPGDPLNGVGSPSMTTFVIDPDTFTGGHWTDPDSAVWSGSGVYLTKDKTYSYEGVFSFLGTPGNAAYSFAAAANSAYVAPDSFVMLMTGAVNFWLEDLGNWTYTETWKELDTGLTITSTRDFELVAVPAPAAVALGLMGLGLVGWVRRRIA